MAFVEIVPLSRCRCDGGTFIEHDGLELAVFRLSDPDRVIVTDNTCPHAGGNLSGGSVSGGVVSCPWHHWEFDLDSGVCIHSPQAAVRRYPTEVRNGIVCIDLPDGRRRVADRFSGGGLESDGTRGPSP